MLALYHARRTGRGQRVDVSMQEVVTFTLAGPGGVTGYWSLNGLNITRSGPGINLGHLISRVIYPCKDGYVAVSTLFGIHFPRLVELMKDDNAAGFLEDKKWLTATRFTPLPGQWQCTQEEADAAEDILEKWLLLRDREEIMQLALENNLLIFPVRDVPDNLRNEQLDARDYWRRIEHPEIATTVTYPGPPVVLSETPWRMRGRAPLLGEHNAEVYRELGIGDDELRRLREAGVV
jgi:crotonobetainyl-CoA:carnitine CoA-transferase CaiB-like acyl-CoA transferase